MNKDAKLRLIVDSIDGSVEFPAMNEKALLKKFSSDARSVEMEAMLNKDVEKMRDFVVYSDTKWTTITSWSRNVSIHIRDYMMLCQVNPEEASARFNYVTDMLKSADAKYEPVSSDEIESTVYYMLLKMYVTKDTRRKSLIESISEKREAKRKAKLDVSDKWFKIGAEYTLKKTGINGDIISQENYRCIKYMYTVGKNPVKCVVMKHLGEKMSGSARCLSATDCRILHIKYEKGLYMFPMSQRFYPIKKEDEIAK